MKHSRNIWASSSALALATVLGAAAIAAPEVGSVIGNQAVATYTNSAGDTITVTSNKVETIVQQVAGLTLTSDNTETIAPGGKAFLPHIITNDGNGPDAFTLTAVEGAGDFAFSSVVIYADADMDGVADNATPLTSTPVLAPGERFGIVIVATAPSTATSGQSDSITVTATSLLDGTSTTNVDTLTVSTSAIMELVKSMTVNKSGGIDPNKVDAGDTVTITLTYTNTGLAPSTNYTVSDALSDLLPYSADTAIWSDAAGSLNEANGTGIDATNGSGETIAWTAAGQNVGFVVSNVAPGRTGSVTFQATISAAADAGLIENSAIQSDDSGSYPNSNIASIIVDETFAHTMDDRFVQADTSILTSSTDDDGVNNDVVLETSDTVQGGTVMFEFVIGNDANTADSFTLDVSNVDFPAGTTFRFVGADGATPIVGDIPLDAGEGTKVYLIATLPTNVAPAAAGTTDFTATVTATSTSSGADNTATAEFDGAILGATVDLQNTDLTGDGANPDDAGSPWLTQSTDPGQTVTFPMTIENQGTTSDNYNLSLANPLPTGWTVEFQLADGTVVTNTGTIPAGTTQTIYVVLTPPADELPGTTEFEVVISSPVTGQGDSVVNAVTVNQVIDLSIEADQTVQAAPGGVVDILHTVTNEGNVTINEGTITASGLSEFSGAIYYDANGNGELDATDPIVSNISDINGIAGIAPGETITLIYRVQAGEVIGMVETGTIEIESTLNNDAVTDSDLTDNAVSDDVVVVSGDVTLEKYQAIDPACDGNEGAFSKDRQAVEPGQCIRYRIVATNTGTASVSNVTIKDIVPNYTAYETCATACGPVATPAGSTVNAASVPQLSSSHGALVPGSIASLEFTVRVDQ